MNRSASPQLHIELHGSMSTIPREQWNRMARLLDSPFLEWEWLNLLETSGSVCEATGWIPVHLVVRRAQQMIAAAPLYIKTHSIGEFVFDHGWAEVATQLGIAYYPKLVGMIPATPSAGYRFLTDSDEEEPLTVIILQAIDLICQKYGLNSCAFNFVDPKWQNLLHKQGYLPWSHQGFEWHNPGFRSFDEYLLGFTKNQRRNIRRERQASQQAGITIRMIPADEAPDSYAALMYDYYRKTNDQFGPWAARYLTKDFFEALPTSFGHRILFDCAYNSHQEPIAMSLLAHKNDRLIGRYWGADMFIDCLHFNVCYYSPIEWAIEHNIRSFDPGIGSSHKIRRGFQAIPLWSMHRFYDERMQKIMADNIPHINKEEQNSIDQLNKGLPFRTMTAESTE